MAKCNQLTPVLFKGLKCRSQNDRHTS